MKILLTGGSGLLGTELKKHLEMDTPTHEELDITDPDFDKRSCNLVIHAAAYTNVDKAEIDIEECFRVNIWGTANLLERYANTPFVYISSEYSHKPVNVYSYSKLAGEILVKEKAKKYLIIRTLFKPNPWPWRVAWIDQMTQGDYVDVIAKKMVYEINKWLLEKDSKLIYVGTGRKSMYELAKKTYPEVKAVYLKRPRRPKDYL